MKKLDIKLFLEESFIEERVLNMHVDLDRKIATIETNGASISPGLYLSKVLITISNWTLLIVNDEFKNYDFKSIAISDGAILNSIYEFHVTDSEVILVGIAVGYPWLKWIFTKANIEVYGEYNDEANNRLNKD